MAKSLRSKRKRKMRAIKRIKCGEKELIRLQDMVSKSVNKRKNNIIDSMSGKNEDNTEAMESNQLIGTQLVKKNQIKKKDEKQNEMETKMETDSSSRNGSTLRDEFGHYPIWMNKRQIKKHKHKLKIKRIQSKRK